jgi:hypothetical protein
MLFSSALRPVEADQLASGFVVAGLQALNLADPAVGLGFLDAVAEVGDDVDEPWAGARVESEAGAADAGLTEMILSRAIGAHRQCHS